MKAATSVYLSPCFQLSLQSHKPWIINGYGEGKTIFEAKQQALFDIASKLETHISGQSKRETIKTGVQVSTSFSQDTVSKSSRILSLAEANCTDINDPSGIYHIAMSYDQRSPVDMLADKLKANFHEQIPGVINWQGPSLIVTSSFIQTLEKNITQASSKTTQTVSIQLYRKDQRWWLALNNITMELKPDTFSQIFNWAHFNTPDMSISIEDEFKNSLSQNMFDGDDFRFEVRSKQQGYLSIFDVYEDGRVTKIRDNIRFQGSLLLPEHKGSFSAGLITPNTSTQDQYIFIITKQKIDTSLFSAIMLEQDSVAETNNYSLNIFLSWLDKQDILSAKSLLMKTAPKK